MATNSEIRAWARDRGVRIGDKGPVSAQLRAEYERARGGGRVLQPFPKPSEVDDLPPEEFGLTIEMPDEDDASVPSGSPPPASPPDAPGDAGTPEPGEDEPPAHARHEWRQQPKPRAGKAKAPPRLTQAVRGDIAAKISFALEIPGRIWQARDPVCGTVFVEQRPEIAHALTEVVCQSPDLVAWFTGSGGQFMLWMNVMASLWPVVTVAMAHHVYHTIEAGPGEQVQPDYRQYAA